MTNKELISIANMELRDQLEAERVKVEKLKELLKECRKELDGEFGVGAEKLVEKIDEVLNDKKA